MEKDKAQQQANLALILAIAGIAVFVVSGIVLAILLLVARLGPFFLPGLGRGAVFIAMGKPVPLPWYWYLPVYFDLITIALTLGPLVTAVVLARRARDVPAVAARARWPLLIATIAIVLRAAALIVEFVLTASASQNPFMVAVSKSSGEVGLTLLILATACLVIAGIVYLILGVVPKEKGRRWTTVAAILQMALGGLVALAGLAGIVVALLALLIKLQLIFALGLSFWVAVIGSVLALLLGGLLIVAGIFLLRESPWVRLLSPIVVGLLFVAAVVVAVRALALRDWLVGPVAVGLAVGCGFLLAAVLPPRRGWGIAAAILQLILGGLGFLAGLAVLLSSLPALLHIQPLLPASGEIAPITALFGDPGWNQVIVSLVLGLGSAALIVAGVFLLYRAPWARIVSPIFNALFFLAATVLALLVLLQQDWLAGAVAAALAVAYGFLLAVILPPSKVRFALPFTLLSPAIVGLCLLVIYPVGYEIVLSFSNMSLSHFTVERGLTYGLAEGWQNFKNVFVLPVLKQVMFLPSIRTATSTVNGVTQTSSFLDPGLFARTVLWTAIQVPCHVLGGLVLALLLNRPMKLRGLYRTLLVIPWALPPIIAVLAWRGEFHYNYGFLNIMLTSIGLPAVQWTSEPVANFAAMNIVNIWLGIPFMMVILLGGLQSIPGELYEAAEIDGASWWQQFRKITFPLLQPVMTPAIILGVIWTFNNFNVSFFINQNELESSDLLVTALYRAAFEYNRYGFAAAFALVIFLVLLVFSIFYIRFTGAMKGVTER
jgi:arabinogalactan oligomer/maltooligosaccharide transport system permease protein